MLTRTAFVLSAVLLSAGCVAPAPLAEIERERTDAHAIYLLAPAPGGVGSWKFNGGDGTAYPGASAACQGFASSYDPPYVVDRLEATASAGTKRCWAKPAGDPGEATAVTLVYVDDAAGAVELADADGLAAIESALVQIAKECEQQVGQPTGKQRCMDLGTQKHACASEKVGLAQGLKGGAPNAYSEGAYKKNGAMLGKQNPSGNTPATVPRTQQSYIAQAKGFYASGNSPYGSQQAAIRGMLRGKIFPDIVIPTDPTKSPALGNIAAIYDFKFPCPPDKTAVWGRSRSSGKKQDVEYDDALHPVQKPKRIQPGG